MKDGNAMGILKEGCTYGRGTRWGIGTVLILLLAFLGWTLTGSVADRASAVVQHDRLATRVRVVENASARVDERLKAQGVQLDRIERAVTTHP